MKIYYNFPSLELSQAATWVHLNMTRNTISTLRSVNLRTKTAQVRQFSNWIKSDHLQVKQIDPVYMLTWPDLQSGSIFGSFTKTWCGKYKCR